MSDCYSFFCHKCQERIWVAQSSSGSTAISFYRGEPEIMKNFKEFLFNHFRHPLTFDHNDIDEYTDYKEIGGE